VGRVPASSREVNGRQEKAGSCPDKMLTLYLHNSSLVHWNIVDIPTGFICIVIFFDGAFEYVVGAKIRGYVGTNAELLCVKLCNTFVKYITCYFLKVIQLFCNWHANSIIPKYEFYFMAFYQMCFQFLWYRHGGQ
jgi:hypothetical protein